MTWDDIYERADGAACGEPTLKAKDEARHQVRQLVMEMGCPDPDDDEIPEETIEEYCRAMEIRFDEYGNIVSLKLPIEIEEMIYQRKNDKYLRQDIINVIDDVFDDGGDMSCEVSEEKMKQMMQAYHKQKDCNIPYNVTLENVVKEILMQ